MKRFFFFLSMAALFFSCSRREQTGEGNPANYQPRPVVLQEPDYFVKMQIPSDNPLTEEGIELGRMLFYDPILSGDSTMSCAGCHELNRSFTDGRAVSTGSKGLEGKRSALPLLNVGYYYKGLFWDGRVSTLEEQALHPVEDPLELSADWSVIEKRLQQHPVYPGYFQKAFGTEQPSGIDRYLVAKALAQFQRSLVSYNSKFDRVKRGEAAYTESESRGWKIFFDAAPGELPFSECGHCHVDPLFTSLEFHNNGIDEVTGPDGYPDKGRAVVTGRFSDQGKFRVPTLRNIALTAPYMHDGRFVTLEEVIDHYRSGGHFSENVSPNVRRLNFSEQDKADLIAFLHTLTDSSFLDNPGFANPFKKEKDQGI